MKLVNIHSFLLLLAIAGSGFNSLQAQSMTLQQCLDTALANNKNLQSVRNNLRLSSLRKQEAKSGLLPKLTTSADYRFYTNLPYQLLPLSVFNGPEGQYKEAQFGVPHNLGANVQLAVPLYQPTIKAGIKSAEIAADIGDLLVEKSEEQVIAEVSNLYYNAQILQHQILFADSNLINLNRMLLVMQQLKEQGLAKGTDIQKIELQQTQLQAQRSQLAGKLTQVVNGMNFLMGRSLEQSLTIPMDIEQGAGLSYTSAPTVDVRISQQQSRLLDNELKLLKKSKLPTISLVANFGLTGFGYFKQPDPFFKVFPIGFIGTQVTYPIWNRTTHFKIIQKEAEITSSRFQAEHIQAQNDLQVANAVLQKKYGTGKYPRRRATDCAGHINIPTDACSTATRHGHHYRCIVSRQFTARSSNQPAECHG
jgi:outer membrane protein TolC